MSYYAYAVENARLMLASPNPSVFKMQAALFLAHPMTLSALFRWSWKIALALSAAWDG